MQVRNFSDYKGSVEQASKQASEQAEERANGQSTVARHPSLRTACPECGGRVIENDEEAVCSACSTVVAAEFIDLGPTRKDLGMVGFEPESNIETVTVFRTDKGLHTKIMTGTDGRGNPLSGKQRERAETLKTWHMRYQFQGSRTQSKRHNEALRDVEMLLANLALPEYVGEDAARWLQQANDAGLPGGHMAWESLAGGAVLLAATRANLERRPEEVARYAKTSTERLCAAARKLRVELDLSVPPVREDAVATVGEAIGDNEFDVPDRAMARHLMALADDEAVGPGTPRLTVATAAVYAALKLCGDTSSARRYLTQTQVVEAVSPILDLSTSKLGSYNCRLIDAFEARHGTTDPAVVLDDDENKQAD